ncbi:hypothetical protein N0V90_011820 [Kalmusia sp. IMI 367209]|nr:hypothetical protein N0V90_011820 [Kalmusia sp. IMI 367209]
MPAFGTHGADAGPVPMPPEGIPHELRHYHHLSPIANANLRFIHAEHARRQYRMFKSITSGRTLKAHALFKTNGCDDIQQFIDGGYLKSYAKSKAYYTDGAYRYEGQHEGISSAAAVWTERDPEGTFIWEEATETFERDTGYVHDAELYGIKLALETARRHVCDPEYLDVENIVIFTDSKKVVKMLAGERNAPKILGPMPLEENWALEHVYEDAAALHRWGVNVVIAWIKAHKAKNPGNTQADRAAARAIFDVLDGGEPIGTLPVEKINWTDAKEEYLYRRSRPWLENGEGMCFVEPSLSGHAEELAEETRKKEEKVMDINKDLSKSWSDFYHGTKRKVDYGKMYAQGVRKGGLSAGKKQRTK